MASKSRTQSAFLAPPADSPQGSTQPQTPALPRRQATLYDAIAGRSTQHGLSRTPTPHAIAPETVLFQRAAAPDRHEETDTYFASDNAAGNLPDSDLLKALHVYAADFYASEREAGADYRSLDETALLALGVLMEELCRDQLGEAGDLVFTEGEVVEGEGVGRARSQSRGVGREGKRRKVEREFDG
ncbi:hypothetical protein GMDG_07627 [Pseudogymnoascus destructans 20631-21]|uniref:Uncharacterized protein n=1 Tax=Pseudogymnoascus destructans (strain ATCC MYA-4855 / 20631-21) TaxID=658429 RepID=L8FZ90_PSED2|nr:hypothetical protein GMDG_07627 [Pseudogymnoascus destructans 20631-21]